MWRGCFVFCVLALSAQVGTAQSSSGNIVTGEAKVEMISTYNGCEALAKPEKIMIQDFTPVGDIVVDESAAARLHRRLSLKHGSDEDSTPEVLTQQVQAAFSKALMEEFTKANVQSERSFDGGGTPAAAVLIFKASLLRSTKATNPSGLRSDLVVAPAILEPTLLCLHSSKVLKPLCWNSI